MAEKKKTDKKKRSSGKQQQNAINGLQNKVRRFVRVYKTHAKFARNYTKQAEKTKDPTLKAKYLALAAKHISIGKSQALSASSKDGLVQARVEKELGKLA